MEGTVVLSQVSFFPSTVVSYSLLCSLENKDDTEVTLSYNNHNYFIKVRETPELSYAQFNTHHSWTAQHGCNN